jgi:hypothetical protein
MQLSLSITIPLISTSPVCVIRERTSLNGSGSSPNDDTVKCGIIRDGDTSTLKAFNVPERFPGIFPAPSRMAGPAAIISLAFIVLVRVSDVQSLMEGKSLASS